MNYNTSSSGWEHGRSRTDSRSLLEPSQITKPNRLQPHSSHSVPGRNGSASNHNIMSQSNVRSELGQVFQQQHQMDRSSNELRSNLDSTPSTSRRDDTWRREEYGGRRDDRSTKKQEYGRSDGGRREERRRDSRNHDASSWGRVQKRPREVPLDDGDNERDIKKERDEREKNTEKKKSSKMDQYGYADQDPPTMQHPQNGGGYSERRNGGEQERYFDPLSSHSSTAFPQRSFPSKSNERKRGRGPRSKNRNKFNLGDTSDEDDRPMLHIEPNDLWNKTPSRSPEPRTETKPKISPHTVPPPAQATVSRTHKRAKKKQMADCITLSSDDETELKKKKMAKSPVKTIYDARTHVTSVVSNGMTGGKHHLKLPSLTGTFFASIYNPYPSMIPAHSPPYGMRPVAARKTTVVPKALEPTVTPKAPEPTVIPKEPAPTAVQKPLELTVPLTVPSSVAKEEEGEDEYEESEEEEVTILEVDTVAPKGTEDTVVDEREEEEEEEERSTSRRMSMDSNQPMNSSTPASAAFDDDDVINSPRRDRNGRGYSARQESPAKDLDRYESRPEMNQRRFPNVPTQLHPGVRGSKLVVDLWKGEATIEGEDGRQTGFTNLTQLTFSQRCNSSFRVSFGGGQEPATIDYDTQSRMNSNDQIDFSIGNAIVDGLNGDWARSHRFRLWDEQRGQTVRTSSPPSVDWREKQERKRKEQREKWGEWTEKEMGEAEEKREAERREQSDRDSYDLWLQGAKQKEREDEEEARALRSMGAQLMGLATRREAELKKSKERREREVQRRADIAAREQRRAESREKEKEQEDADTVEKEQEKEDTVEKEQEKEDTVEKKQEEVDTVDEEKADETLEKTGDNVAAKAGEGEKEKVTDTTGDNDDEMMAEEGRGEGAVEESLEGDMTEEEDKAIEDAVEEEYGEKKKKDESLPILPEEKKTDETVEDEKEEDKEKEESTDSAKPTEEGVEEQDKEMEMLRRR